MNTPFSAVLVAAGHSTRMGRDKALLEIEGRPMWQRQREVLAATGPAEIFLSVRPEQTWARSAAGFSAFLHDAFPSAGPLAGVTAALERTTHPHLLVLAIDLPRMTPEWLATLLDARRPGVGVVGRRDGLFEPLAAVYPREFMPLAWEALAGGRYALQGLLGQAVERGLMTAREIGTEELAFLENWNEPQQR